MYYLITIGVVVTDSSLLYLSALSYIIVPVFLNFFPLVWCSLLLNLFHSLEHLCHSCCLGIVYLWCCFSVYSFLVLGSYTSMFSDSTSHVLKLLMCIIIHSLCMLSSFFYSLGKLCCIVGSYSLSFMYILL